MSYPVRNYRVGFQSWLFLSGLLLAWAFPATQAWADPGLLVPREQNVLYKAQSALKNNDVDRAINLLSGHLKSHAKASSAKVYIFLGNAWDEKKEPQKAFEIYRKGLKKYPNNYYLCHNLGLAAVRLGENLQAARLLEKAWSLQQKRPGQYVSTPELLYQAAVSYYNIRNFSDVRRVLEQLFETRETRVEWLRLYVQACCEIKDWDAAEKTTLSLLREKPAEAKYWDLLGRLYLFQGKGQQAAAVFEISYSIQPPSRKGWEQLANLYQFLNLPLETARCLKLAKHGRTQPDDPKIRPILFSQAHRYTTALEQINATLSDNPSPENFLLKGKILFSAGKYPQALEILNQATIGIDRDSIAETADQDIRSEALFLQGLAAWHLLDWEKSGVFFQAASTSPRWEKRGLDGAAVMQGILLNRKAATQPPKKGLE